MNILLGMRVETDCPPRMADSDWRAWNAFTARVKDHSLRALTTEQAIDVLSADSAQATQFGTAGSPGA
jgi:hypothetical protein